MQIGKIKVKFVHVMMIIEEAFAWLRWTINNCRIIRNSWIFQPIEHVFDKISIFQFKKIKNICIQLCPSKSAIHILQVMINWKLVNPVDLKLWLKWTISACIGILFSFDWWIFKTNSNSKHLNTSVKKSSLETKY